jgi:hypothetical protein
MRGLRSAWCYRHQVGLFPLWAELRSSNISQRQGTSKGAYYGVLISARDALLARLPLTWRAGGPALGPESEALILEAGPLPLSVQADLRPEAELGRRRRRVGDRRSPSLIT